MFAPLTHFNASLFWDGALKRQTHFSFLFLVQTPFCVPPSVTFSWPKFFTAFFESGNVMTRETVECCHGGGCLKESKHFLVSQALPSLCPLLLHVPLHALLSSQRSGRMYRWPCSGQLSQWELLAWEASWPSAHPPSSRASTGGPKVYWRLD